MPFMGLNPVQVALAVSRKPTAMVAMNPHNIPWTCQATPKHGARIAEGAKIQIATDIAAHAQPLMYKGRKPRLRKAERSAAWAAEPREGSFITEISGHTSGSLIHLIAEP